MRRMVSWRVLLVSLLVTLAALAPLQAQSIPPAVQIALNQILTGVTPFTTARVSAEGYLNFGATIGATGYGIRDSSGNIQVKADGGAWATIDPSAMGDLDASYWTRVSEANLTNETIMGALATGLVLNATTTGIPTIYTGTSCTNQFPRALNAVGVATCVAVDLAADVTGVLPVANGGTGLASGTSGGILGYTAAGTLASSGALTANAIVLGGGPGVVPTALATLGTTTTVLHGNAAGAPTFGAIVLTTEVTGILPGANGGTGNGFFAVTGPAASLKTFTFPNASATVLTDNAAVTAAQGGTGLSSYTTGDLLQATGATTLAALAATSTGNALISGGVGVVSSWGKIGLATHVSGTLPATNGGTGNATYATGDLLFASSATTIARLADVAAGRYLRSGGVGVAPLWSTLVLPNAATQGDLLRATAANTVGVLAIGGANTFLRSDGSDPLWSTLTVPNAATQGDLFVATAANAMGVVADVAVGQVLISGGVGVVPAYSATPNLTGGLNLAGALAFSATPPTVNAGFGTTPSVTGAHAAAFAVDVGTGGTATAGTLTMPAAPNGWACAVEDETAVAANDSDERTVQTASTTASVTVENQTISTGAAVAWTASDVLVFVCAAY